MDRDKFTANAPGKLIRIPSPERPEKEDWAFIPARLPADWQFPQEMWPLLMEAREALASLDGIGQTLPHPELLLRPLQAAESISSSRIEGTYVTPQQLLLFELAPKNPQSPRGEMSDWLEVFHYTRALRIGHNLLAAEGLPICHRVIREMHKVLMEGSRQFSAAPGEYRKRQVQIGSSGRFIPPPPSEIEALMGNFELFANTPNIDKFDPLIRAYMAHYQFESIHPFQDGNGRIGRALLALMIAKWLGHAMPWIYMSAFFDRFKDEYIDNLFRVSANGSWSEWIRFCLNGTISQANDSIRRCRGLNALRTKFHEMKNPTKRSHKIIEGLFCNAMVTIASVKNACRTTYNTASREISVLIDAGILAELPNSHPKSFYSPEIMTIAYGEPPQVASPRTAIEPTECEPGSYTSRGLN